MKPISIWIDDKEHDEAKAKARKEDLSLSQLVRKLLREFTPTEEAWAEASAAFQRISKSPKKKRDLSSAGHE